MKLGITENETIRHQTGPDVVQEKCVHSISSDIVWQEKKIKIKRKKKGA